MSNREDNDSRNIVRQVAHATWTTGTEDAASPTREGMLPSLEHLLRVIPIAQTRAAAALTVSLLALEVYADGFVITLQLHGQIAKDAKPRFPAVTLQVSDDRDGRYTSWPSGSGGGTQQGRLRWRAAHSFSPALAPHAQRLDVVLSIGWREWNAPRPSDEELVNEGDAWVFSVPIPPGEADA